MAKTVKYRAIKFPTGVVAYLDKKDQLKGTPAHAIVGLAFRESPDELNAFEVFVKNYLANEV